MPLEDIGQTIKGILITAAFVAFSYFVIPWILVTPWYQAIYFSIVMTTSNIIAVVLSWVYFSHTRCYSDEANIVTMMGYKVFGASATHMFIFIIRVTGNVIAIILLLTFPETLGFEYILFGIGIRLFLLTTSITTSLYFYEMVNNAFNININKDVKCNDKSLLCGTIKDPLFCDF